MKGIESRLKTIKIGRKREKHVCVPRPKDFFGITTYQCGCGIYFTEKQYKRYLKEHNYVVLR